MTAASGLQLVERGLRSPTESGEVRVFSVRCSTASTLLGLAEFTPGVLFLPLHLQRLFPIPLRESSFACTSDGILLGKCEQLNIVAPVANARGKHQPIRWLRAV